MFAAAKMPALYGAGIVSKVAVQAVTAPPTPPLLPVIVYSHGLAGMRTINAGICCDLASRGYVVAAVEHRYRWPRTQATHYFSVGVLWPGYEAKV